MFHVEAALKARALQQDKDYIVRNDKVVIVDEFAGRLLEGRRFSEKNSSGDRSKRVAIQKESKTLATIRSKTIFACIKNWRSMTGTAATEAEG